MISKVKLTLADLMQGPDLALKVNGHVTTSSFFAIYRTFSFLNLASQASSPDHCTQISRLYSSSMLAVVAEDAPCFGGLLHFGPNTPKAEPQALRSLVYWSTFTPSFKVRVVTGQLPATSTE